MKLKTTLPVKPELIASKARPVLTKIHLNVEAGEIQVTDSYMAARFPVEVEDGDTSGPIPVDALKASRKPPLKRGDETRIALNGDAQVLQGDFVYLTVPRETADYTFPDIPRLYPDAIPTLEIGLNAKMLYQLAKAMGSDTVRLRFLGALQPVRVEAIGRYGDDEPAAIIMPVKLA